VSAPVIQTHKLTKQYRRVAALRDCSVTVPEGRICALVGPNGAGKTTLLRVLAGLARSTGGSATVLGAAPRQDPEFLAGIGYLAQDMPLYRRMSAADHIRIGAHLNANWNAASARARLSELDIPLNRPIGVLSGGQRAQVALALTLAKQPQVLLLDEPVAALDPLARRHFLSTLTAAVADAAGGLTVMLSSHLVSDLERVCDHLILLSQSRVQLCGDIDELLGAHKVLVAARKDTSAVEKAHTVVWVQRTARQVALLTRLSGPILDPAYQAEPVSLEELVLGYMGGPTDPVHAHLAIAGKDP
jgi:ABC-2 type transport system ATP-binding protein